MKSTLSKVVFSIYSVVTFTKLFSGRFNWGSVSIHQSYTPCARNCKISFLPALRIIINILNHN